MAVCVNAVGDLFSVAFRAIMARNSHMPRIPRLLIEVVIVAIVSISLGLAIRHWRSGRGGDDDMDAVQHRIELLEVELANPENAPDYQPKFSGDIATLDAPALDILRQLLGVVQVEALVTCPAPTQPIIHIRDWHLVPRDDFVAVVNASLGRKVSPDEADVRFQELQLQVDVVQHEQLAMLRLLVRHHSLKRTLSESVSTQGIPAFRQRLDRLRKTDEDLAQLVKSRAGLSRGTPEIDREIATIQAGHRLQLLEVGASGRLAIERLAEVVPLEDDRVFDAGWIVGPYGTSNVDPAKMEPRHDAQVKAALDSGPVSVIVLGCNHDLSDSVRRLGGGKVEYFRVMPRSVARFLAACGQ
jgi:hypothetical protein